MTQIHIFSGLLSSIVPYFRGGTLKLVQRVNTEHQGAEAKHHNWILWRWVAWRLAAKHKAGTLSGPIILGGHSNGVLAARKIASKLAKRGIHVDYEFAIDPTIFPFPKVGHNVRSHDEFHASFGIPAFFRRITRNRYGKIHFVDGWIGKRHVFQHRTEHVALSYNDEVHDRITGQIMEVLEEVRAQRSQS